MHSIHCGGLCAGSAIVLALAAAPVPAYAQVNYSFNLQAQPLAESLRAIGRQAGVNVVFDPAVVAARQAPALRGSFTASEAFDRILSGSGLIVRATNGGSFLVEQGPAARQDAPPVPAQGASAGQQDAPIDGGSADGELTTIVVTAQRRTESLQNVAAAITALDSRSLSDRGISGTDDLQFAVPSLNTGTIIGSTQIAIRGVGRNVGLPAVAISVDGVFQPRSSMANLSQIDLQRVEVLRGPQGTLYGRNANGGAVNFITNAPTDQMSGQVLAGFAEYDEYHLQTVANVPISDRVRTRVVVDYTDRNHGFVENIANGPDLDAGKTMSGRLRIGADLTSDLELDLNFTALRRSGRFDWLQFLNAPPSSFFARVPFLSRGIMPLEPWTTSVNDSSESVRKYQSAGATLTWQAGFGEIKSISAFQRFEEDWDMDRDGFNLSVSPSTSNNLSKTFTQEFDVSGSSGRLDWVVGAFYMNDRSDGDLRFTFGEGLPPLLPPNAFLKYDFIQYETKAYAGFADMTFNVSDKLRIVGGARYSEDHVEVNNQTTIGVLVGGREVPIVVSCPAAPFKDVFDSFTYRYGGQYDVDDDRMLYVTASTGFKSGGVNTTGCNDSYLPETITSYEAGLKSSWFDRRLTVNASAFHYDYEDFQLSQLVGLSTQVTNAASAKVDGAEMEVYWRPDSHWSFNGYLTLLDARYGSYFNSDVLNPGAGLQNMEGRRLNNSPRTAGGLGVEYKTSEADWGRLTARVDMSATSRIYLREFNALADSQAGYALANVNLIWTAPGGDYSVRLYGKNVTDKAYIGTIFALEQFGSRIAPYGPPRQIGMELRVKL